MQGFESEEHERSIWQALKAQAVPLKFAYAGSAAHTHNRLASRSSYQSVATAIDAEIRATLKLLDPNVTGLSICEVGPGNGTHTVAFLRTLYQAGTSVLNYLGLDFSRELLSILERQLAQDEPRLPVHVDTWDFEAEPTTAIDSWRSSSKPVLILMIGHTIGNPYSPLACLKNIFLSSRPGDGLVLSAMLRGTQPVADLVKPYLDSVFIAAALEPLRMGGLNISEGSFHVRWEESTSAIIGEFVLSNDQRISYREETIVFSAGSIIRCFLSRRFQQNDIATLLSDAGWLIKDNCLSHDESHLAVAAFRPKPPV